MTPNKGVQPMIKKQRFKQIKIWKFNEAPEDVQKKILAKYSDINVSHDWDDFDGIIYDEKSQIGDYDVFHNYSKKYFDIERDWFIQFPDLQIKDEKKLLKMLGLSEAIKDKISDIVFYSERSNNTKIKFMDLTGSTIDTDETYEDYLKNFEDEKANALTKTQFNDLQRATQKWDDLMHNALVTLRNEFYYQISDEAIAETLIVNEYDFDESGNII